MASDGGSLFTSDDRRDSRLYTDLQEHKQGPHVLQGLEVSPPTRAVMCLHTSNHGEVILQAVYEKTVKLKLEVFVAVGNLASS